jgi:hypothetical protein
MKIQNILFFKEQKFVKENRQYFWNVKKCFTFNMESSNLINYLTTYVEATHVLQ